LPQVKKWTTTADVERPILKILEKRIRQHPAPCVIKFIIGHSSFITIILRALITSIMRKRCHKGIRTEQAFAAHRNTSGSRAGIFATDARLTRDCKARQ
jgi:hypothetical protein